MDEREPQESEKETYFGDRVRYCAVRKHMICVSLLDGCADRSIFSSGRLRQPLQKNVSQWVNGSFFRFRLFSRDEQ
jgi:hypothetical protein